MPEPAERVDDGLLHGGRSGVPATADRMGQKKRYPTRHLEQDSGGAVLVTALSVGGEQGRRLLHGETPQRHRGRVPHQLIKQRPCTTVTAGQ